MNNDIHASVPAEKPQEHLHRLATAEESRDYLKNHSISSLPNCIPCGDLSQGIPAYWYCAKQYHNPLELQRDAMVLSLLLNTDG